MQSQTEQNIRKYLWKTSVKIKLQLYKDSNPIVSASARKMNILTSFPLVLISTLIFAGSHAILRNEYSI